MSHSGFPEAKWVMGLTSFTSSCVYQCSHQEVWNFSIKQVLNFQNSPCSSDRPGTDFGSHGWVLHNMMIPVDFGHDTPWKWHYPISPHTGTVLSWCYWSFLVFPRHSRNVLGNSSKTARWIVSQEKSVFPFQMVPNEVLSSTYELSCQHKVWGHLFR